MLVAGCTVGPDYKRPLYLFRNNGMRQQSTRVQNALIKYHETHPDQWWKSFNDPSLNRLITDAIAANLDLKQALVRVKEARAQRWITITAGLPSVTGRSNLSRRFNNTTATSQTGATSSAGGGFGIGNKSSIFFNWV